MQAHAYKSLKIIFIKDLETVCGLCNKKLATDDNVDNKLRIESACM